MRADFSSMLVAISDGFLVDSALILSPARPSELSSRCGAVPFRAILAIWRSLVSWMVSRAQHGSNLDHQTNANCGGGAAATQTPKEGAAIRPQCASRHCAHCVVCSLGSKPHWAVLQKSLQIYKIKYLSCSGHAPRVPHMVE